MMNTLQIAQAWIHAGFSVIPIEYRSKRPAFDALRLAGCTLEDGHISWEMFKSRQANATELWLWFGGPRRNLGIVTGWDGLIVLDFDQADAYGCWLAWAMATGGRAARVANNTYRVFSARGVHVYMICEEPVESYAVPGIDVKARWGYVLTPPSVHPCGHEYYSVGHAIERCKQLSEVFPFEKPARAVDMVPIQVSNDPWEAAGRAVVCEKGAVLRAKSVLRIEDMLHLDPQRARQMVLCPFHVDHNPSMLVDLRKQTFRCFGCGKFGDSIDMFALLNKLTVREAIAEINQTYNLQ